MKKKIFVLLIGILMILLSACEKETGKNPKEEKFYDCQKGFLGSLGNKICESPDGYYFLMGRYLMFADENLEQTTFVCNKPECLHNGETMENKSNCDAFFSSPSALSYYEGNLYVLSDDVSNLEENVRSIYEVTLDGSGKKVFYTGGAFVNSFCIHRGECYVYEKKYMDEKGKVSESPILTITRFSMKNPKETKEIFRTDKYKDAEINDLKCYQDFCYFSIFAGSAEESFSICKKINLDTEKVTDFVEGCDFFKIGKEQMFSRKILEHDPVNNTWKSEFYQCDLEGKQIRQLTKKNFRILEREIILDFVDDKYLYFRDINYGANEVPKEEQLVYVYTYEGEEVCQIPFNEIHMIVDYYPGNERYLFYYDVKDGLTFYYADKDEFGKGAKFKKLISGEFEDYNSGAVY